MIPREAFISTFQDYVNEWHRLEEEYYCIPSWRLIKQMQNIRKRERLTKRYETKMEQWGLL